MNEQKALLMTQIDSIERRIEEDKKLLQSTSDSIDFLNQELRKAIAKAAPYSYYKNGKFWVQLDGAITGPFANSGEAETYCIEKRNHEHVAVETGKGGIAKIMTRGEALQLVEAIGKALDVGIEVCHSCTPKYQCLNHT